MTDLRGLPIFEVRRLVLGVRSLTTDEAKTLARVARNRRKENEK